MLKREAAVVLGLIMLSSCLGQEEPRGHRRGKSRAITQASSTVECDAGSSWNGRGWPSQNDCQRKADEGFFSGSCDLNALGCYGIPGGAPRPPGPTPPTPPPSTPPTSCPVNPSSSCDAGSSWNGRGWGVQGDCTRKRSEGYFSGSCEFNCATNCYGIPGGAPTPPTTPPGPTPGPTGAPVPGPNCDAGGSWNGRGWGLQADCQRKAAEGSFQGTCDFNYSTSCYGIPGSAPSIPLPSAELPLGPYPRDGLAIAKLTEQTWPSLLVPTRTVDERKAQMMFLRDRMIEIGICAGLDLGLNLKRGGPEISIDYLTWQSPHGLIGVDIGMAYDDHDRTLELIWGASNDPYAKYQYYDNRPNCR